MTLADELRRAASFTQDGHRELMERAAEALSTLPAGGLNGDESSPRAVPSGATQGLDAPNWWVNVAAFLGHDHPTLAWSAYVVEERAPIAKAWGATDVEALKRAHLIAAAPELYEALDLIWRAWADRVPPDADMPGWPDDGVYVVNDAWKAGFFEKARAVLARARGEA